MHYLAFLFFDLYHKKYSLWIVFFFGVEASSSKSLLPEASIRLFLCSRTTSWYLLIILDSKIFKYLIDLLLISEKIASFIKLTNIDIIVELSSSFNIKWKNESRLCPFVAIWSFLITCLINFLFAVLTMFWHFTADARPLFKLLRVFINFCACSQSSLWQHAWAIPSVYFFLVWRSISLSS